MLVKIITLLRCKSWLKAEDPLVKIAGRETHPVIRIWNLLIRWRAWSIDKKLALNKAVKTSRKCRKSNFKFMYQHSITKIKAPASISPFILLRKLKKRQDNISKSIWERKLANKIILSQRRALGPYLWCSKLRKYMWACPGRSIALGITEI